jgi:hypothetical protein
MNTTAYPFRIARDGAVYIGERMFHGRLSGRQIHAGHVWREGREWRNDQASNRYATQDEAASELVAIISKPWMFDR